ncbi:hypothetical protein PR202_ga28287 [Eleusine coracana subsp. coracana]|uniref:GTD-binding domain-containing protein n=1 Tax=Eleusine coracana subsp. coracana TaxID=191504 RepID=A0AAV5DJY5_ELECO|nr:hypothetical protein PR202_ga28287 [Eleusine coracana subsp. coracana]
MEPGAATAATSSAPSWRGMVRRHSQAWEERERAHRRVEELEADVARLRAEKRAAERAAAALRAHLEAEQGAAETAATEAMAMIARLQREKSAAMIEAREFRRVAEVRTARDRELQDQIAEAYALAASYQAILRAHGIDDPDVDDDGKAKGVVINKEAAPSPSLPHPAATDEFQDKHPVDVSWVAGKTKTVAGDLRARVEALEADSVAVRREVAALRAERAQAVLTRRRDDAAGKQQRFPVLGIFKARSIAAQLAQPASSTHPYIPSMDPASAATASSAFAWRRALAGAAPAAEEREALVRRREDEMEAAAAALREGKEAAERAAAALRAELESERAAAETAASEAMAMIARLQREKSAAMIEAREFRRIVEGRDGHDREVQDRLAGARALAASYRERLRAHGVDPDEGCDRQEEDERVKAGVDGDDINCGGDVEAEEELKYAVSVRCAAAVATNAAAAEELAVDENLCARVEALEADSAAVRREVAALRVERAKVALARRLWRDAAAARAVVAAANKRRFSLFAVFKVPDRLSV